MNTNLYYIDWMSKEVAGDADMNFGRPVVVAAAVVFDMDFGRLVVVDMNFGKRPIVALGNMDYMA